MILALTHQEFHTLRCIVISILLTNRNYLIIMIVNLMRNTARNIAWVILVLLMIVIRSVMMAALVLPLAVLRLTRSPFRRGMDRVTRQLNL